MRKLSTTKDKHMKITNDNKKRKQKKERYFLQKLTEHCEQCSSVLCLNSAEPWDAEVTFQSLQREGSTTTGPTRKLLPRKRPPEAVEE